MPPTSYSLHMQMLLFSKMEQHKNSLSKKAGASVNREKQIQKWKSGQKLHLIIDTQHSFFFFSFFDSLLTPLSDFSVSSFIAAPTPHHFHFLMLTHTCGKRAGERVRIFCVEIVSEVLIGFF